MRSKQGSSFPKRGNSFPSAGGNGQRGLEYRTMIAAALRKEFGQERGAAKTIMQWTGASERTAKNWLAGREGPASEHLIQLVRHSDAVQLGLMEICGRTQLPTERLWSVREMLVEAVRSLNDLSRELASVSENTPGNPD